ncbi:NapC/NirT family cytochrome c [Rhodovastum atsumiense]|uniref:NapC/NirT family cytochrome c n=1 Tax=Rhodovastum atsumiense TaxID=504468 RepID=UPI00139F2A88|nr:NapC/NirT family cytochrome c [Rhodovastum atsumiense]
MPRHEASTGPVRWHGRRSEAAAWPPALLTVAFGLFLGLAAWRGADVAVTRLEQEAFCLSCHEPNVASGEQARLAHLSNRPGLRVQCPDCHVGSTWTDRLRFVAAHAHDIGGFLAHLDDTAERQDAHRLDVASRVWTQLEADGSAPCRRCHDPAAMDRRRFSAEATREMRNPAEPGRSCITCHKGVLHPVPIVTAGWFAGSLTTLARASHPAAGSRVMAVTTRRLFLQREAAEAGQRQGSVVPGASLEVLEVAGSWLRIRLAGWQQEGAARAIYGAMGQRMLAAALAPAALEAVSPGPDVTDPATGQVWRPVTLTGWIESDGLVTSPDAVWSVMGLTYAALCASCHALPRPSVHTPNQWIGTMSAKRKLLPLDDDGNRLLLHFLQMQSGTRAHDDPPPPG